MTAEPDPLDALLGSVSDGLPVDWDTAARSAGPTDRCRVEALREVSRIGEFSRGLQRGGGPGAARPRDDGGKGPVRHWGDMLLLERLGTGAHADVYRAWDPRFLREVALKLLRPEAPGSQAETGESPLLDEGRALARVRHPHVVTVHGIDRRDGRVGLWMELVRGATLEQEVRVHGPLESVEAARLGLEIGSAVAAVHAAGLIHRDIKPANVVRDPAGRYVLADFGLGLRWDDVDERALWPAGTPVCMAPELLAGAPPGARSDVYALGLLLWHALAGHPPFAVGTLGELRAAAASGPSPRLREVRPDLPASLVALVERAMAPLPERRFAGAQQFVDALRAGQPRAARRMRAVVAVAAVLVLAAVGLWRAGVAPALPRATGGDPYAVEATLLRRGAGAPARLANGDRVEPGDRLSLELRATRPAWVYVLNEDDGGERYLLFPQPRFDTRNPLPPDSTVVLPGAIAGRENAWTVTSRGGRESFLMVVSPRPVPELEADLARFAAPEPGRPIDYAAVGPAAVERLRGIGGLTEAPPGRSSLPAGSHAFAPFRALAGRETGVRGVWVRQIVLQNPR